MFLKSVNTGRHCTSNVSIESLGYHHVKLTIVGHFQGVVNIWHIFPWSLIQLHAWGASKEVICPSLIDQLASLHLFALRCYVSIAGVLWQHLCSCCLNVEHAWESSYSKATDGVVVE